MDVAEGAGLTDRLHNLLLAMTGRIDDDALNTARELIAVGQPVGAAELLAGCLLAGKIPVSANEQYALRRMLAETGSNTDFADRFVVTGAVPADEHRFSDQDSPEDGVAEALSPVVHRLAGVRSLRCAWRVTPAGVTYGAVPRRVLLVEVGSDGSVSAVSRQLLEALRRAGVSCSVEAYRSGAELPEHHHKALASAREVRLDLAASVPDLPPAAANRESSLAQARVEPPGPVVEHIAPEGPVADPVPVQQVHSPEATAEPQPAEWFPSPEPVAEPVAEQPEPVSEEEHAPPAAGQRTSSPRMPAAVDAKLTDRERNLLRRLHDELAQREHDRGGSRWQSKGGSANKDATPAPHSNS